MTIERINRILPFDIFNCQTWSSEYDSFRKLRPLQQASISDCSQCPAVFWLPQCHDIYRATYTYLKHV